MTLTSAQFDLAQLDQQQATDLREAMNVALAVLVRFRRTLEAIAGLAPVCGSRGEITLSC